jgi:hypothetical protein
MTKLSCNLKKAEDFFYSQPVKYGDEKIFCLGSLDKDVHVYSIEKNQWFMLEKEYVGW